MVCITISTPRERCILYHDSMVLLIERYSCRAGEPTMRITFWRMILVGASICGK